MTFINGAINWFKANVIPLAKEHKAACGAILGLGWALGHFIL